MPSQGPTYVPQADRHHYTPDGVHIYNRTSGGSLCAFPSKLDTQCNLDVSKNDK